MNDGPVLVEMQIQTIRVLLIEDNPDDVFFLRRMLQRSTIVQFDLHTSESLKGGLERLAKEDIHVLLLDLSLSDSSGLDTFHSVQDEYPSIPIIVLSGLDDERIAVNAVHAGAQDYLVKGRVNSQLLTRAIVYSIERTEAKAALLKAQEKYRIIFENAVEGIFQTTPEGCYLSANPALTRIYGYATPEELIDTLTDIGRLLYVDPDRRLEFIKAMQENDVVTNFESKIYRKDGTVIWISENVRAVRNEKNELVHYEGTAEDITDRKQVQADLRNSEALYHSLVETLPQNIFRKDLNERFTFANQRFCDTLQKPLDEIVNKTDFDFFPPELAVKYQRDDRVVMQTGKLFEAVEEYSQLSGGGKRYVQVVKTPLRNASGKIIGLQGIFWDITERKEAEERERRANEKLARSQEELRKKNEMMEDDLRMAHEIQQAILPQQYPSFPKGNPVEKSLLRFCHRYHPTGEVGGDFFNVHPLSDHKAGVFICDVMGHGVRSALVTAMVRGLVEELRPVASDPGLMLASINKDLRAILQQTGTPLFTTAFYLVIDLEQKLFHYSNAGHPKPFLLNRKSGQVEMLDHQGGKPNPALGLFPNSTYTVYSKKVTPGDLVMLFTDGLFEIEGANETQFNQEMLLQAVRENSSRSCTDLFDLLLKDIKEFSVSHKFVDDVCLVGVEVSNEL